MTYWKEVRNEKNIGANKPDILDNDGMSSYNL